MSGHSKWSTIKRQKGSEDARRGQLFTKLSREIAVAVRGGGGADPSFNFRLRLAIDKAKGSNMPLDTIERAVQRAAGGGDAHEELEEVTYEGYGPGGTAIMLQALTTNRNRTAPEIRSTFGKAGGSLGEAGCVAWNFEPKGLITVGVAEDQAEDVALLAIDAGAEDVKTEGDYLEVYTQPDQMEAVRKELERQDIETSSAEISMVPKSTVSLDAQHAAQALRLLDSLEELLDVQRVYSNADFPDEVLEKYGREGQVG